MRSIPRPDRPNKVLLIAVAVIVALAGAGCGGSHGSRSSAPTTTLLRSDSWVAPAVIGPPSTKNFCTLLVAVYEHEQQISVAANVKVKERIVADYVETLPEMLAEAPPNIASPAKLYLTSVSELLGDLDRAGLNYQKVKGGNLAELLLNPAIKSAGAQVVDFSQNQCHYDIPAV